MHALLATRKCSFTSQDLMKPFNKCGKENEKSYSDVNTNWNLNTDLLKAIFYRKHNHLITELENYKVTK